MEKGLAQLEQERVSVGGPVLSPTEKDWAKSPTPGPQIDGDRVTSAVPGQPLRITARVSSSTGIAAVRLRYRSVTQFDDYATLEMQPTSQPGVYAATVPGSALNPKWDFMYFIEAIPNAGDGAIWPDLLKEAPYIIVKLQR